MGAHGEVVQDHVAVGVGVCGGRGGHGHGFADLGDVFAIGAVFLRERAGLFMVRWSVFLGGLVTGQGV